MSQRSRDYSDVLAKEELNQIMRLANGSTIKFSQRVQYALQIAPQK